MSRMIRSHSSNTDVLKYAMNFTICTCHLWQNHCNMVAVYATPDDGSNCQNKQHSYVPKVVLLCNSLTFVS
jgi:hypothetical protein